MAGMVSLIPLNPSTSQTIKNGMERLIRGSVKAVIRDTSKDEIPSCESNVSIIPTGIPIAPKAPEAPFAIKQSIAACSDLKPSDMRSTA